MPLSKTNRGNGGTGGGISWVIWGNFPSQPRSVSRETPCEVSQISSTFTSLLDPEAPLQEAFYGYRDPSKPNLDLDLN